MTCERMSTTVAVDNHSILANDTPVIIPEDECTTFLHAQVQNDMEVPHLSAHRKIPDLEPLPECISPVNHPTQLIVEHLPIRLRQHRHERRVPFRIRCPLVVPLLNWTGPRATDDVIGWL